MFALLVVGLYVFEQIADQQLFGISYQRAKKKEKKNFALLQNTSQICVFLMSRVSEHRRLSHHLFGLSHFAGLELFKVLISKREFLFCRIFIYLLSGLSLLLRLLLLPFIIFYKCKFNSSGRHNLLFSLIVSRG